MNWRATILDEVVEFTNGGAWDQSEYTDEGIRVARVTNFVNESIDLSECKYLSHESFEKYQKHELHEGDLVVATVGSHPSQPASAVGRPIRVPRSASGCLLNQNAVCIRPKRNDELNQRFLFFFAKTDQFKQYILSNARGAANQARMSIERLRQMPLSLPPLTTQRKIAGILSAYDDLIENNTRRIAILEAMAQAIYREWFVEFRFPGHEKVKLVDSTLGKIPEGWKVSTLGWLVTEMPWKMITAVDVAIATAHSDRSTAHFLVTYLNSPEHIENAEKHATGTTRPRVSRSALSGLQLVLPPLTLQRRFTADHLKRLLQEDHRFIFTLIQKFGTKTGQRYPKLSDRADIIVMTDEAHRSQYDTLALNMRNGLPKAAFIGFTGTPLMAGEERTKEVFGDYVSIYNFSQSVEDGATVPLFYENRIPELQLANDTFKEDLENLIEQAELDDEQEKKLEREFAREYHLITRDDRLEKVAEDLVDHFMGREQGGKGMVICIDKLTAVKMFDKVRQHWKAYLADLKAKWPLADSLDRPALEKRIKYMEETDMAVVVSQEQNEVEFFKEKGFDIEPIRKRMVKEDLETKFKNPDDPFRLVFVCAMWLTGFDAPCVSTIYLDKPMKNHTLMQTIARANRVFGEKNNGLIVDYVGVFRDLQKALAIYGSSSGGNVKPGECPIQKKDELVAELRRAIDEAKAFCVERGVVIETVLQATGFQKIAHLDDAANHLVDKQVVEAVDDAVEKVIVNDDLKKKYLSLAGQVVRLYKAILPDQSANEFVPVKTCLAVLAEKIRSFTEEATIDDLMEKVGHLLDDSVAAGGYRIYEQPTAIDLSQIDFEALKAHFQKGRKHTEAEKLKAAISNKLRQMVELNKSRIDLVEKFKKLIDEYNKGLDVDGFFENLVVFVNELTEEEKRGVAEQLDEEQLAIFDILTKPTPDLPPKEKKEVKQIARKLLQTLKEAKLVLDWRKKLRTRADVFATVKTVLDDLPRIYTPELYQEKCDLVYRHVFDAYQGEGRSIYESA